MVVVLDRGGERLGGCPLAADSEEFHNQSSHRTRATCAVSTRVTRPAYSVASAVEPGREQSSCFCQVAVPDPVRGLLTPRLLPLLSASRSRVPNRPPRALNRRSERWSDRHWVANSIPQLDERRRCLSLSYRCPRGTGGGTLWGTGARARCPPRAPSTVHVIVAASAAGGSNPQRQLQSTVQVAARTHRAAFCAARQVRRSWRGGQSQYRGVSDHAIWPLGLPSPRPRRWSLTPRCLCLSRNGSSSGACVRAASRACA